MILFPNKKITYIVNFLLRSANFIQQVRNKNKNYLDSFRLDGSIFENKSKFKNDVKSVAEHDKTREKVGKAYEYYKKDIISKASMYDMYRMKN